MLYKNAYIYSEAAGFFPGSFRVEHGKFTEVLDHVPDEAGVDLCGAKVIPGLVDIHIHGAVGADFSDGDYDQLVSMARYLAQQGVTSFAPASMTLPYPTLETAFQVGKQFHNTQPTACAKLMGIHMEGPFFSEKKKGAQNSAYLQVPDIERFFELQQASGGLIRIVDLAPELPGSEAFIRAASQSCTVSVAHTDAGYEEAAMAFQAGASHLTHLFNAMPPIHHREPGVIGAAAEREDVTAELICDGYHVHPGAVRMAFRLFPDRICLISDALRCCGMEDGCYTLGGQTVFLKNGVARLSDGTIAGSSTNLFDCMRNAVAFCIREEAAIRSATILPAKVIGKSDEIGSIEPGKSADFIVCTKDLQRQAVYINGNRV